MPTFIPTCQEVGGPQHLIENWSKCFELSFNSGLHGSLGFERAEQRGDGETSEG